MQHLVGKFHYILVILSWTLHIESEASLYGFNFLLFLLRVSRDSIYQK